MGYGVTAIAVTVAKLSEVIVIELILDRFIRKFLAIGLEIF